MILIIWRNSLDHQTLIKNPQADYSGQTPNGSITKKTLIIIWQSSTCIEILAKQQCQDNKMIRIV